MSENWAWNLVDGHRTLPVLLEDLAQARSTIHLSVFLFFNDPIGQQIADVLCERARAGVKVRVLVNFSKTEMGDPFSTGEEQMMEEDPGFPQDAMDVDALAKRLREAGVQVHDSNLDFDLEPPTDDPGLLEQCRLIRETSRIDAAHIDHRKVITIDGWVGYCGSANLGAQYLHHHPFDPSREAKDEANERRQAGLPEPWWKWHDGLVRFEGAVVREIDAYFRERWVLDGGDDYRAVPVLAPERAPRGIALEKVTLFANQPDSTPNPVKRAFLAAIDEAREELFLENPYLYHPEIIAALLRACARGVKVELILPGMRWNDNAFSQDAMQFHYRALLRAGASVFEYQHHFTHLKLAAIDRRVAIVGSANLNFRSLEDDTDFELIARIEGRAFVEQLLSEVRDADRECSRKIELRRLGWRMRFRDPRTRLMVARRLL